MTSKAFFARRTHTACIVRLPLGLQTLSSAREISRMALGPFVMDHKRPAAPSFSSCLRCLVRERMG